MKKDFHAFEIKIEKGFHIIILKIKLRKIWTFLTHQENDENQKADDDLNEMIIPLRYPESIDNQFKFLLVFENIYG